MLYLFTVLHCLPSLKTQNIFYLNLIGWGWCLWYSPVLHHKCLQEFEFGFLICFGIHSLLLLLSPEIKEELFGCIVNIDRASTSWITWQTVSRFESECTHVHAGVSRRAHTDTNHIVTERGWKGLGAQKKYLSPLNCFITGIPSLLGMCSAETRPNWQSFPQCLAAPWSLGVFSWHLSPHQSMQGSVGDLTPRPGLALAVSWVRTNIN